MKVDILRIDPREIKPLEVNARYMKHEEYNRLVENIRKDGQLTSAPFLCRDDDGRWLCLSGNHRVKASIDAGLQEIVCFVTEDALTKSQKTAIQLSHNSLVGKDDMATLKQLYESIDDIDYKKYSGLDDKTLELLDKFSTISISEANLEYQTLNIVFLPDELRDVMKVFEEVKESLKKDDYLITARMKSWDDWMDTQEAVAASYNIKNVATVIEYMLKFIKTNIGALSEAWKDTTDDRRWVPVETCIGRNKIPAGSAKIIKKALDRIAVEKEYDQKEYWNGLEVMAQSYMDKKRGE